MLCIAMRPRKYYAERKGFAPSSNINFDMFKRLFLHKYLQLEREFIFREATGYHCVDEGYIVGNWGEDIDSFMFLNLRLNNIWPIQEYIDRYDEPTLFSLIELLYEYASEPQSKRYHDYNDCGWHTWNYEKEIGQIIFRKSINDILKDYKEGYMISIEGEILQLPPTGMEALTQQDIQTNDPRNIDERLKHSITKFLRYDSSFNEKKEAIRNLADILEYLKDQGIKMPQKDDSALFQIINNFDLRHHRRDQQGDYDKEIWYDWLFYTFLSTINVLLKMNEKYKINE